MSRSTFLREARLRLGLTQPHMADVLECNPRTYERWENGRSGVSAVKAAAIKKKLKQHDINERKRIRRAVGGAKLDQIEKALQAPLGSWDTRKQLEEHLSSGCIVVGYIVQLADGHQRYVVSEHLAARRPRLNRKGGSASNLPPRSPDLFDDYAAMVHESKRKN